MLSLPADWLTAISSLAALGAAVATFLTVWEMRKQRLTMYRPDIAFKKSMVFFYWHKEVGLGVPVVASSHQFDPSELDLTRAIPSVYLNAVNIGLGSARAIDADWDVDIKECIAILSSIDAEQHYTIWDDPAGVVTFETDAGERNFQILKHAVIYDVPYVLPKTSEGRPFGVDVPFAYAQFLAIYVALSIKRLADPTRPQPVLPAIRLRLSFRDIAGKLYRKSFSVRASFIYLATPGQLKPTQLCGQAEFEILSA